MLTCVWWTTCLAFCQRTVAPNKAANVAEFGWKQKFCMENEHPSQHVKQIQARIQILQNIICNSEFAIIQSTKHLMRQSVCLEAAVVVLETDNKCESCLVQTQNAKNSVNLKASTKLHQCSQKCKLCTHTVPNVQHGLFNASGFLFNHSKPNETFPQLEKFNFYFVLDKSSFAKGKL